MDEVTGSRGVVGDQSALDRMRAADGDRKRVAEQLRSAHDEGRLTLTEYDERVQQAWAARTYGELAVLTADLPQVQAGSAPKARGGHRDCQHRQRGGRRAVMVWAGASAINLAIWAIVSLTTLSWVYPWWVWVAGPWGAILLVNWLFRWHGRRKPSHYQDAWPGA
jgi:Domain of unknown function (DUF1707)